MCAFDVFALARVSVSVLPIANLSPASQSGFEETLPRSPTIFWTTIQV